MRRKKNLTVIGLGLAAAILAVPAASAQEVVFDGEACPLTVYTGIPEGEEDGSPLSIRTNRLEVLGSVGANYAAVLYMTDAAGTAEEDSTEASAEIEESAGEEAAEGEEESSIVEKENLEIGKTAEAETEEGIIEEDREEKDGNPEIGESPEESPETAEQESADGAETAKISAEESSAAELDDEELAAEVTTGWQKGYVAIEELEEKIPAVNVGSLETAASWENQTVGSRSDTVKAMQDDLIYLGLLDGTADGSFGPMTEEALNIFLAASGLERNGTLDVFAWFLLEEAAAGKPDTVHTTYPPVYDASAKFSEIYDLVTDSSLLDTFATPEWKYEYDVFTGRGIIREKAELGSFLQESPAIDRISITAEAVIDIARSDQGAVILTPAVRITSEGAYRPYIRSIAFQNGSSMTELPSMRSEGSAIGVAVQEETIVPVTAELAQKIGNMGEDTPVYLMGTNKSFELQNADIEALKTFMEAVEALL